MVGKVLEANKGWDIGKEVIDCVTKTYPGAYPIHPKVSRITPAVCFRVQTIMYLVSTKKYSSDYIIFKN